MPGKNLQPSSQLIQSGGFHVPTASLNHLQLPHPAPWLLPRDLSDHPRKILSIWRDKKMRKFAWQEESMIWECWNCRQMSVSVNRAFQGGCKQTPSFLLLQWPCFQLGGICLLPPQQLSIASMSLHHLHSADDSPSTIHVHTQQWNQIYLSSRTHFGNMHARI